MLRPALRRVTATRYVTPLREGGSMPGLCEADDDGTYVVKFHGAGQGRRVLVAEVLAAALAGALGLDVPELVVADVDPVIGRGEPDEEVQDLLLRSPGANLGMDFLPGALSFDPAVDPVEADWAARVLWFDAFVLNVDRSWRNPNALWWGGRPWLIDHGAALYFHHDWARAAASVDRPLRHVEDHLLLRSAAPLGAVDAACAGALTPDVLAAAVDAVPPEWVDDEPGFDDGAAVRRAYLDWFTGRLAATGWRADLDRAQAEVSCG
ncbi:HipA family kinase [Kineococcus endophyticus]|uniref:HipA family kinase n=1 Tax=Kineococcus endophyticus TaxID=1181883 RepID=A0ABV3P882_9ACTN